MKRTKLTNKWYWTKFQYQHTFSFSSWPKNNSDHSVAIAACSVSNAFLMMVAMCILLLSPRRCFPFWKNLIESDSVMQKRRGSEKEARGNQAWSWKNWKVEKMCKSWKKLKNLIESDSAVQRIRGSEEEAWGISRNQAWSFVSYCCLLLAAENVPRFLTHLNSKQHHVERQLKIPRKREIQFNSISTTSFPYKHTPEDLTSGGVSYVRLQVVGWMIMSVYFSHSLCHIIFRFCSHPMTSLQIRFL